MSQFEKQSQEELDQLNGTLESYQKNLSTKDATIDKLRADIDSTRKSNYQLNSRLQSNEQKVAQLQLECTSMNDDAMREKAKATELQRTLADEARTMRQKYDAIKNAVTIALKDVRSLKNDFLEEKDSTGVSLTLIQQQISTDMSRVNLALKVHTQLKEEMAQKANEAEASASRIVELERSLEEIQEQSRLQLRKQSSSNASLHSERELLMARIEELSIANQNDSLLVENLTYELDFKTESLNEAEAKIEEQGRCMSRNQKLFEKAKEKLEQEAAALRFQVSELRAACLAVHNSNNTKIAELEGLREQQLQQQGVLERTLAERQAELSGWKEKATTLTAQLQQMEQAVRRQEELANSSRSESAQQQKELNDILAEMEACQLKYRQLQQDLKDTSSSLEDVKNQRLADQEEKTLLEKLLTDSSDRLEVKTAELQKQSEKIISLELELTANTAEINMLRIKVDSLSLLSSPAATVENAATAVITGHTVAQQTDYESAVQFELEDLESKLLDVAMQMGFLQQEDEDLMAHVNQSKLTLGRSLYKLNTQYKKKKKLLDSKFSSTSGGRVSLGSKSAPVIMVTPQRRKESSRQMVVLKENIPSAVVDGNDDAMAACNRSMNSLDSLTVSPQQASSFSTAAKQQESKGVVAERELLQLQRKLTMNTMNAPNNHHPPVMASTSSSAMKVEEGGDSSLNSLLAFSNLDDDSPSEGPSSPVQSPTPNSNRRPLRNLSPAVTAHMSSVAATMSSPSPSSRRLPPSGHANNSFPVRSPLDMQKDMQKDTLKEELRLATVRENDLKKLLEVPTLVLLTYIHT